MTAAQEWTLDGHAGRLAGYTPGRARHLRGETCVEKIYPGA